MTVAWDDLTHEQKMVIRADLYARGVLTRYSVNIPRRFHSLKSARSWRGFFGRRSSRRNAMRTRDRIIYPRLTAMTDARPKRSYLPWGRWRSPRPLQRLHDAFCGRRGR